MGDTSGPRGCLQSLRRTFCCFKDCGETVAPSSPAAPFEGKAPGPPLSQAAVTSLENAETAPASMQHEESVTASTALEVPSWLDRGLVEAALRTLHPELEVTTLHVAPAVAEGENYACVVFRAEVETASHGRHSVFLKCVPESEARAALIRGSGIMLREMSMYTETLPLLRAGRPSHPACLKVVREEGKEVIILEDLRPLGYRTHPRKLGLDLTHCNLALTELAHLHGQSIALRIRDPIKFKTEIQDKYLESAYTEESRYIMGPFITNSIPALVDSIKHNLPFRFHNIANIFREMCDTSFSDLMDIVKLPDTDEELSKTVIALNHGDFWSNNMLFKYEDDRPEPKACCLVDFQITRCASPVLDLLYFLFTSTTQATRRAHMDGLLTLYLDEARKAMRERGVDDPGNMFYKDMADLKKDMRRHALFGFLLSMIVTPVVIAQLGDVPQFEAIVEEGSSDKQGQFAKLFSGGLFCQRIKELLEDFDDMGFFVEQQIRQDNAKMKEKN